MKSRERSLYLNLTRNQHPATAVAAYAKACRRELPSLADSLIRYLSRVRRMDMWSSQNGDEWSHFVETTRQYDAATPAYTTIRKFPTRREAELIYRDEMRNLEA